MDQVRLDREPFMITKKRTRRRYEFTMRLQSPEQMAHLLCSPAYARGLSESIEAAGKGNLIEIEMDLKG